MINTTKEIKTGWYNKGWLRREDSLNKMPQTLSLKKVIWRWEKGSIENWVDSVPGRENSRCQALGVIYINF